MDNQSSKYIIPYSIGLVILLASMLVFVYFSENNGWFSNTDELVDSITQDTSDEELPVSTPLDDTNKISKNELSKHNTISDCYTAINDSVYLLTPEFIDSDATDIFDELVCGSEITDTFDTQIKYTLNDLVDYLEGELTIIEEN